MWSLAPNTITPNDSFHQRKQDIPDEVNREMYSWGKYLNVKLKVWIFRKSVRFSATELLHNDDRRPPIPDRNYYTPLRFNSSKKNGHSGWATQLRNRNLNVKLEVWIFRKSVRFSATELLHNDDRRPPISDHNYYTPLRFNSSKKTGHSGWATPHDLNMRNWGTEI